MRVRVPPLPPSYSPLPVDLWSNDVMIERETSCLLPIPYLPRRYTVSEIKSMLEKAAQRSPHLQADFERISREEAYRRDPAGPLRIVDYLNLL
jgi:hypothetical protein